MTFCWSFLCRRPRHDSQAEHGAGLCVRSVNASSVSLSWQLHLKVPEKHKTSKRCPTNSWFTDSLTHWCESLTCGCVIKTWQIPRRCWIIFWVKITFCLGIFPTCHFHLLLRASTVQVWQMSHSLLEKLKQLLVATYLPYHALLAVSFPSRCAKSRSRDQKCHKLFPRRSGFLLCFGGKLSATENRAAPLPHPHPRCSKLRRNCREHPDEAGARQGPSCVMPCVGKYHHPCHVPLLPCWHGRR